MPAFHIVNCCPSAFGIDWRKSAFCRSVLARSVKQNYSRRPHRQKPSSRRWPLCHAALREKLDEIVRLGSNLRFLQHSAIGINDADARHIKGNIQSCKVAHRLSPIRLVVDRHEPVRSPFTVWQEPLSPHATRTETVTPANSMETQRESFAPCEKER